MIYTNIIVVSSHRDDLLSRLGLEQGWAWCGEVRRGAERRGKARNVARHGWAWFGVVWLGAAWIGVAWQGKDMARRGPSGQRARVVYSTPARVIYPGLKPGFFIDSFQLFSKI